MLQTTDPVDDDPIIYEIAAIFAAGLLRCRKDGIAGQMAVSAQENQSTCLDLSEENRLSVLGG